MPSISAQRRHVAGSGATSDMKNAGDRSKAAAALNYLRKRNLYFQFDKNERVVEVTVYDTTDADETAAHVGHLHDLRILGFPRSNLTDEGLRHLKDLVHIRELWLNSPSLSGDGLSSLVAMTEMEELILYEAPVGARGIGHISQLRNLVELKIEGGNFCDSDMAPLAALVNLEKLVLSENDNTDNIEGTFAEYLTNLPQLRDLNPGTKVTDDGLARIAGLSNLEELYLTGTFTDAGLRHIGALQKLHTLGIASDRVTARGVAVVTELPELTSLRLETPLLNDDGIPSLLQCSDLESLTFVTPCMSESGLQHLRESLPKCGVYDFERDLRKDVPPTDDEKTARPRLDSSTPFKTLLAEASDRDLVNGTFSKISDRYRNWVDASQYTPEERVIMLVWHTAALIGNGGFEYLFAGFFDGDPDYRVTAEAYRVAGSTDSYEAFQKAFQLFPGGTVPHDPEERTRLYAEANKSAREGLNRQVWHDDYLREKKLAEFIRKNAAQLAHLEATE